MPFTFNENGALLVSGIIDGSGAATRVAFWTAAQTLGSSANLYWDNVTSALGIKDTTPQGGLDSGGIGAGAISGEVNATVDHATAYSATAQSAALEPCFAGQNKNAAADFSSIKLTTRQTNATRWEIFNIWSGTNYQGHLTFVTRTGAATFAERMRLQNDGYLALYTTSPDRRFHAVDESASTNVIIPVARIESQVSGGAGAAGHGPGFEYYGESSTTENTFMAEIAARWSVATHASRRSRIEMYAAYQANEVLCGVIEAPANASVDGNSRGVGAVDLQSYRTAASQVAFGNYSALVAGQRNEIGGAIGSVVIGGYDHSIGGGADQAGVVAGYDHLVDGAAYAGIIGGREALLNNYGQITRASGMFSSQGDAQSSDYVARLDQASHAVNTWYPLYLDGVSEQMTIQPSTAWTFEALIVGLTANAAQQWGYRIIGLIERDNAGNTTMAASTTTTIFESDANYDAQAVADNVNEALDIEVRRTGGVDYSIQWVATIRIAESTH